MTNFPSMLREYRIDAALSQNALARRAGIDPAYVHRLEKGGELTRNGRVIQTIAPRREAVLALARGLGLDATDTDRLLYSAGLAPSRDYQALYERATARLTQIQGLVDGSSGDLTFVRWSA